MQTLPFNALAWMSALANANDYPPSRDNGLETRLCSHFPQFVTHAELSRLNRATCCRFELSLAFNTIIRFGIFLKGIGKHTGIPGKTGMYQHMGPN